MVTSSLMLAFDGFESPAWVDERIREWSPAGFTLFRHRNVGDADQLLALTSHLQSVNEAALPLLIAADQEGGQLQAIGQLGTPFAGNMALGAVDDPELTREVGAAIGRELRAVGINLDYAPVCDVASRPDNPSLGIRSFGDSPELVGRHAAAFTVGLQSAGVAATVKHFPGKGEAVVDPHFELPVLELSAERLRQVELAPFAAALAAGAKLAMVGHYALPAITGRRDIPATLAPEVVRGLLREQLGFDGVIITDALDMGAVLGADGLPNAAAALAAGIDLLLCTHDPAAQQKIARAIGASPPPDPAPVRDLRRWLSEHQAPSLDVLRSPAHMALARDLAERSITLVRDSAGTLPLRPGQRVLAVMVRPVDLTPADTSSYESPLLAAMLHAEGADVTEVVVGYAPSPGDIDSVSALASDHDVTVIGTFSAGPEQAALVDRVLATGRPTVTVALRTPTDLALYPAAATHVCTYGLLPHSLAALAQALFGRGDFGGRLPMGIPGLYAAGHGSEGT